MDLLSGIASAIAVIQIAEEICTLLKEYTSAVVEAKGDIHRLREEVLTLQSIFRVVENFQNQPGSGKLDVLKLLANPGGLMERCLEDLRDIAAKLKPGNGPTAMKRVGMRALKWPFTKGDIEKKIIVLERYKTIFSMALSAENTTALLGMALKLTPIGEGVQHIDQGLTKLKDDFLVMQLKATAIEAAKKRNSIIEWLATTNPSLNHEAACKKHQANTGKWFVDGPCMDLWKKQNSMLWIHGIPGCGKTVLSSTIIESMKKHSNSNPGTIIAYYYFSFDDSGKQTAYNMVSSLVAQICNSITDLPEDLTVLYDRCFALKQHAAMSELRAILKLLASRISVETTTTTKDIFIVIDALDECSKRDEERQETLDVIEDIRSWSLANFHILITSRKEQDIEERVVKLLTEAPISIEGSQVADDIDLFINERIETVSKLQRLPQDLKTEIKDVLRKGANGMFRWVFCQFEELEKCPPLRASIEKALKNLPRTLNETYERLLASIEGEDCQRIARNCLVWLAFSRRTFYLEELAEAAVLSEDFSEDFSKLQRLPDPHYIFELLGSLIVSSQTPVEVYGGEKGIDMTIQQRNTVTLAHFSIVDYLVSEEIRNSKAASFALDDISAEVFISKTCIRYLHGFDRSTSMQQKIICLEDKFVWDSQRKFIWEAQGFPLLDYACKYWAPHVKRIPFESQARVQEAVMRLFLSKSTLLCWIQTRKPRYPDRFRDITESDIYKFCQAPHEPYFHAAGMGLEYCVSQLLGSMDKVDLSKAIKAAINGTRSVNVVKILLNAGANAKGMAGVDLFIGTARHGSYSLVKTLLEGGANPHTPPEETALVLHDSVLNRDEKVVDLLLEAKVDVNHKDYQDRTPLHFAAAKSSTDLVRRLIVDYHIEVNARDRDGCTALHNAVGKGRTQMVRLLVEFADVNLQDNLGETPLHNAVWGGHAFITEILLEANADHTLRRNDGRTALELVRGPDAETIVQLLQVAADFSNGSSRR